VYPFGHFPFIEFVCDLLAGRSKLNPKKRPFCLRFFKNGRVETYVISYAVLVVSHLPKGCLSFGTAFIRTHSSITSLVNMPQAITRPTSNSRGWNIFPRLRLSRMPSRFMKITPNLLNSWRCSTMPWRTATSRRLCGSVVRGVGEPRSCARTGEGLF